MEANKRHETPVSKSKDFIIHQEANNQCQYAYISFLQ